jgi:L-alanine-DL-glutamate epimerase-like enolase superfamily enzyme
MRLRIESHNLEFIKPAKTSRGEYTNKTAHILICENEVGEFLAMAEASPLVDLSVDGKEDLVSVVKLLSEKEFTLSDFQELLEEWEKYPTLRFALYCILLKLQGFPETPFSRGESGIAINGLVWMNDIQSMEEEAYQKVSQGFNIIKFKVGALDFDAECRLLERFRKKHNPFQVEIRLDANGAFLPEDSLSQLKDLSRFDIHSVEQPIKPKQYDWLSKICKESKIPIALDEELIGYRVSESKKLLSEISPQYLILKPTLLGGFDHCDSWIKSASTYNIGWWSTSALEGNLGLYDIARWVSNYPINMAQGLGTGSLFIKNLDVNQRTKVIGSKLWVDSL